LGAAVVRTAERSLAVSDELDQLGTTRPGAEILDNETH
jgi:hypothetical protein